MAGDVTEFEGSSVAVVTIATGYATSGEVDIGAAASFAIETPSAFDAATISFLASHDTGGTFTSIYNDAGVEAILTVATTESRMYTVGATLAPYRFIKLRCGNAATPATVSTTRTIYIIQKSG